VFSDLDFTDKQQTPTMYRLKFGISLAHFIMASMEDGGVDRTVLDCQQNQLGQVAHFSSFLTFLIFDLKT
jgi:hypothetical protein